MSQTPRIGLALGGGGAAGVAHVPVLQAFDDLGLRPSVIVGCSIGALIGAFYAAGVSADAIHARLTDLAPRPLRNLWRLSRGGMLSRNRLSLALNAEALTRALYGGAVPEAFEELAIPFHCVGTDYHARRPVCFSDGPLIEAIAASICVPGVFKPVKARGRIFVDGGMTDNVPVQFLPPCDATIAVNVFANPPSNSTKMPTQIRSTLGSLRTLIDYATRATLAAHPPDVLIEPPLGSFGPSAIWQVTSVLETAAPARAQTRAALEALLSRPSLSADAVPGYLSGKGPRGPEQL